MKHVRRLLSSLVSLLLAISCFFTFSLADKVLVEGDYEYTVTNGEVTITKYIGEGGDVIIPSTLGGDPVTVIGNSSFDNPASFDSSFQKASVPIHSIFLPNTVITIEPYAFWGCTLSSITLPDGLTVINAYAFSECRNLTEIAIPASVSIIGPGAFLGCEQLTEIAIPDGITTLESSLFSNCTNLHSIIIPSSVTAIEDSVFTNCNNLKRNIIPASVIRLSSYVFGGCDGLNIEIPATVTNIAKDAFCDWPAWTMEPNHHNILNPNTDITLWVYADSEAYRNAFELGIPIIVITEYITDTPGDINGDESINAQDALLALQHSVRLIDLRGDSLAMADMNQDEAINAQDALQILQRSVGL